jgi:hypothetical protein
MQAYRFGMAAAAATMLLVGSAAQAATITLFNTGVDSGGTVLSNGALEGHYSLISGPDPLNGLRVATSANGFPIPPWVGDDASSAWIGPVGDGALDGSIGTYDYRVTFSLAGLNPATASIIGRWSTDNEGPGISLNGGGLTNPIATDWSFLSFHNFAINSGFHAGTNTLDFFVHNDGGPTGLRVEMSGTALAGGVPEPAAWALMIVGFGGVGAVLRSRRKPVAVTA